MHTDQSKAVRLAEALCRTCSEYPWWRNKAQDGPPTEEIELPPTMLISPRLEDFGPGKPLPPSWD